MSTSRAKRARAQEIRALVDHFGSQAAVARALGCTDGSVRHWIVEARVPWGRACQIELVTDGAFTAAQLGVPPKTAPGPRTGGRQEGGRR